MSVPWPFVLTFDDITQQLCRTFEGFIDQPPGKNTRYRLVDAGLRVRLLFSPIGPERIRAHSPKRLPCSRRRLERETIIALETPQPAG